MTLEPSTAHGSILLVEDDADIRDVLQQLLESEGYDVATAANGAEALTYLHAAAPRPQLILLDLMMPVMDGWTFCVMKDRDPDLAPIPVVVVSAVGRHDPRNACLRAVGHVNKPIEPTRLLDLVERHAVA